MSRKCGQTGFDRVVEMPRKDAKISTRPNMHPHFRHFRRTLQPPTTDHPTLKQHAKIGYSGDANVLLIAVRV